MRERGLMIDLRSDGVTRPTPGMRRAIAAAEVGEDQFGEDPSVNHLQDVTKDLLSKEAALWVPTGTMAYQMAIRLMTRPGDDVIVAREAHVAWHEAGGSSANSGVQFTEIGQDGVFTARALMSSVKPQGHLVYPPTTLVIVENTHNRAGGTVFPQDEVSRICSAAKERRVATFLSGARLWHAAVASGLSVRDLAAPFELVSVSLSKGLGAPGGAMLAGTARLIARAVRVRRMFGGAMRQVGFFAAAGLYAIEHHVDRLVEDHANARLIAERLAQSPRIRIDVATVQTNIIRFALTDEAPDASAVVERAAEGGVLFFGFDKDTMRIVTHLDVDAGQCARAAEVIVGAIES